MDIPLIFSVMVVLTKNCYLRTSRALRAIRLRYSRPLQKCRDPKRLSGMLFPIANVEKDPTSSILDFDNGTDSSQLFSQALSDE
jgi:hypothetical protein